MRITRYEPWFRGENGEDRITVSPSDTEEVDTKVVEDPDVPVSVTAFGLDTPKEDPLTASTKKVPLFPALTKPEMVIRSPIESSAKFVFPDATVYVPVGDTFTVHDPPDH